MGRLLYNPIKWIVLLIVIAFLMNSTFVWKLFYPLPYQKEIFYYAPQAGLDPYLVAAVARTESKFNSEAVSSQGAVGVMQLMPDTAKWIAETSGIKFEKDKLSEPDYNIRLGTLYLANLLTEFENNIILALASYNGGRGRVRQWLEEDRWSGELETISDIPYGETREFVKRVLRSYRIYSEIYLGES